MVCILRTGMQRSQALQRNWDTCCTTCARNCTCIVTSCGPAYQSHFDFAVLVYFILSGLGIFCKVNTFRGQLRLFLQQQLEAEPAASYVLSPTNYMTWADEDFIGRISRLSRRAHKLTTAKRTLQRAKCLYVRQWTRIWGSG